MTDQSPPAPVDPDKLWTLAQAARRLALARKTLEDWGRAGKVETVKLGYHLVRMREAEVVRIIRSGTKGRVEPPPPPVPLAAFRKPKGKAKPKAKR